MQDKAALTTAIDQLDRAIRGAEAIEFAIDGAPIAPDIRAALAELATSHQERLASIRDVLEPMRTATTQ